MFSQLKTTYCVTVCLLLMGVNCYDEWETSDLEIEAPCIFDNDDAGRTCNCGFQNKVTDSKKLLKKILFAQDFTRLE